MPATQRLRAVWLAAATAMLAPAADLVAANLEPKTVEAFEKYVRTVEGHIEQQVTGKRAFLWVDESEQRRQAVRSGKELAEPWVGKGDIEIPDGLIHDWMGAVFIPGVTVDRVLNLVQDYANHKRYYAPEVIDSKLVSRDGNHFRVYLKLLKKKVITVVLNTTHDVSYRQLDARRWHSKSYTTKIAEVNNAGEPGETEMPAGSGHGFLWRLNSYWKFQERDGGVYVECRAISLTRGVPMGVGWMINPVIRNLPRESLANTLRSTKSALAK